ncbi:MAG: response regulator [Acidobacteria bacterium]|nr:MAG: response regulator [Acidobacteriota bacterium]
MRVLIAEDDLVSRHILQATLHKWGYEVVVCTDGTEAWQVLQGDAAPHVLILDWMMPGMDGVQICRKVREVPQPSPAYIILLTARERSQDIVAGLQAGADDYLTKPFDREELHARMQAGLRILELQSNLAERVKELEDALSRVRTLQGLLPMCPYCKKIRSDSNYWQQIENYVSAHSDAQFSHGVCPQCYEKIVKPQIEELYPHWKKSS